MAMFSLLECMSCCLKGIRFFDTKILVVFVGCRCQFYQHFSWNLLEFDFWCVLRVGVVAHKSTKSVPEISHVGEVEESEPPVWRDLVAHHLEKIDFPKARDFRRRNSKVLEGFGFSAGMMVKLNWMHKEMEDSFWNPLNSRCPNDTRIPFYFSRRYWRHPLEPGEAYEVLLDQRLPEWLASKLSRRWWELKGLRCDSRV